MRFAVVMFILLSGATPGCEKPAVDKSPVPYHQANAAHTKAMSVAVNWDKPRDLQRVLDAGANPNVILYDGTTILHGAVGMGKAQCVRVLLKHGADVRIADAKGQTPLHKATCFGTSDPAIVEMLVAAGSDPDAKDAAGLTALDYAVKNKHAQIAEVLRKAQAAAPR